MSGRTVKLKPARDNSKKNPEFLLVKQDLDLRAKHGKKKASYFTDSYIDRDRAAVTAETKDIKSDLRTKQKKDKGLAFKRHEVLEEEVDIETYLLQGQHELKLGKPRSALHYLDKACSLSFDTDQPIIDAFLVRSKCLIQLGEYNLANQDASIALKTSPNTLRVMIAKANALYCLGDFEKALIYFHRAKRARPTQKIASMGITQCRGAIENSLCRANCKVFHQLKNVLTRMIEYEETAISIAQNVEGGPNELGDACWDANSKCIKGSMEQEMNAFAVANLVEHAIAKFENLSLPDPPTERKMETSSKSSYVVQANKDILGELFEDQSFLLTFLNNFPEPNKINPSHKKMKSVAQEGLEYLSTRKNFWQAQNPLFSRKS